MIKALGNTHSQARVSGGEMDLMTALGNQLGGLEQAIDPEIAQMLSQQGDMPLDFKSALKEMSAEDAEALIKSLNEQTEAAAKNQIKLNQKVEDLIPQNVSRMAGKESQQSKELQNLLKDLPKNLSKEEALKTEANVSNAKVATKEVQKNQNSQDLLDLKNFMAQQSPSSKQRAISSQYKNEHQSMLANKAFAEKQMPLLNGEGAGLEGEAESSFQDSGSGQEHLLARKLDGIQNANGSSKVFDMAALNKNNGDIEATISQIQDYIVQAKAAKEPSAQMTFNHPELGDVDIFVKKAGEQINVTIGHQGHEAAKFFKQHQGELLQTLQQSGVQVGEFKLESSGQSQPQDQSAEQNEKQFAGNQRGQNQEKQKREDSQRREELWNLLNNDDSARETA